MPQKQPSASAGTLLRQVFNDALARKGQALGQTLEWDEDEQLAIDTACRAADRAEDLRTLYDAERAGQNRPTVVVKLSAELRMVDRQVIELTARVNVGLGPAKSARHQRAADARWARHRERTGT
ncbi:hypothetical protein [Mycolicibacterium septicum]|uniref:hypothetical protein n=1 Tax=Mycolicibacterium septicum TaxID=98668 RepID=UPI001AFB60A9|nr:hypothetical protein [Mycolicibacterium septicum]QRY53390.1 hypothetical protein JVX95_08755 [Mycolicibacterium septicum]